MPVLQEQSAARNANDWAREWHDCFDTLVTRIAVDQQDVFRLLAWRLAHEGLMPAAFIDRFVLERVRVEAMLRSEKGRVEITLAAVYAALRSPLDWDRRAAVRAARLEIDTEARLLVPIRERFQRALGGPTPAVILSDTYLSGRVLRRLLRNLSSPSWLAPRVYSSADLKLTKSTGGLFRFVLERSGLRPDEVVHRGDHPVSDLEMPHRLGIRVAPVKPPATRRYEYSPGPAGLEDAFARVAAGAMRAARVAAPEEADEGALEAFAGHGAVSISAYVAWVLTTARRRGIDRLWFLARDGQVLHAVASILAPALHPRARLDYVHASRLAWCLPAYSDLDEAWVRWLASYLGDASAEQVASTLSLPASVAEVIARWGSAAQASQEADVLAARDSWSMRVSAARSGLIGYLSSRGLLSAGPVLLVDVGWRASLQHALVRILSETGGPAPELSGSYVSLRRRPPDLPAEALIEFAPANARINAAVVECLTRADHGSVTSFQGNAVGTFDPVLQPVDPAVAASVAIAQQMMRDHASALARWLDTPGFPVERFVEWFFEHGRMRLVGLCRTPSQAVGRFLCSQQHDDGPGHVIRGELARRYSRPALWRALLSESFGRPTAWWLEGSIAASTRGRIDFMAHLLAQRALFRMARHLRRDRHP